MVFFGQDTTGTPVIANLGSSSACSLKTSCRTTKKPTKGKHLFIMCYSVSQNLSSFCFLPSCLPAAPAGSLFPPEHIFYSLEGTPASPPASWVHSAQTLSGESIYSEARMPASPRGFVGNPRRRSQDCSCPRSRQIKRLSGVGPSGCPGSRECRPGPGRPWPESHTSPRLRPGSVSRRRGFPCSPWSRCLRGQQ